MTKDEIILQLCERLYICSRLLTRAAERLGWESVEVRGLMQELRVSIGRDRDADVEADSE